jgi:glycine hydroxymethyltransferase
VWVAVLETGVQALPPVGAGGLADVDPEVFGTVVAEARRQSQQLGLIASENVVSRAVLEAEGTLFTNKYAEGLPGNRYAGGCQQADRVEDLARRRLQSLFGAEYANVQPHSGAQAVMAAYLALLRPGDTVLAMDPAFGGHLTHGSPVHLSGHIYRFVHYGVDRDTERLEMDAIRALARRGRPAPAPARERKGGV